MANIMLNADFIISKLMIATVWGATIQQVVDSNIAQINQFQNGQPTSSQKLLLDSYRYFAGIPDSLFFDGFQTESGTYARDWQNQPINYKVNFIRETLYAYGYYTPQRGSTDGEYYYPAPSVF